ncbi:efflux transporter outer membrane subunit [Actimicrobium sp. CCI2.3]|uniref:efflux transporter outer membrane subunit n=1 Tax=Actimicrobium sp. CCI2.3 TaxID=3048616 RepID=UPI002AB57AEE|nr:efflux transporter outer membrane subunit [Actimicrobium sp. CCI2.3]MDY7573691.1 efflux transporter outer membrane subunit [Actimicrobium sp. CCI2.3]MEB0021037.1 efflux transporter outer membrane subunit [Actimicrobium sp. CCI2.3]
MTRLTLLLLAAGLLSACSLAPLYVQPAAPVAATFVGDADGSAIAADTGWRTFFPDQRLQALITAALIDNRDLRTAALRIEEARALYNVQSADLLPNINGTASGARARVPGSLSMTGQPTTGGTYQIGFGLASFELDFFGRVRSLNDAALAQYLATSEARLSVQISLVSEVAKAYLAERGYDEQLTLARQTLEGRLQAYQLAQQRYDVGASSELDLRLSETLVQTARVSQLTLQRQRAQASNALTLLVGRATTDLPPATLLSEENITTRIAAGLPSDLMMRRPDIRAAEQRLKSANANIGAARAAFFPRISLTAAAGSSSNALSGLFDAGSGSWSFAPQLVLPIFDAGRNRSNLTLAQVRTDLAVVDYEKVIQIAFREVSDALVARGLLDEQVGAQQAVVSAQTVRLTLAQQRFDNGIASALDVVDAQRELFIAQQGLVQIRQLRLTNAVDLYRSLGGGLTETTGQPG